MGKFNQLNGSGTIPGKHCLQRSVVVVGKARSSRPRLAEGQCHEARAEQDKAACGQYQEAIGYEVMVTHGTPAALVFDARSDRIKLSERAALKEVNACRPARVPSGPRAVTFKRVGKEDRRAYQTHQCRNRLDHR